MKLPNPNEVLVKNFMERVTNETPLDIDYEPLIEEAAESLKKALRKQFVETLAFVCLM